MNTTLPQSGEVFDFRYRIACRLGRGAEGYVFGATELETGKRVAIKCWVGPHAEDSLLASQQFVRSAHEARLFDNPHIVEVFAAEAGRTVNYCVMDWLEGMTLARRMARKRPSPLHDAYNIVVPCMRAIAEAHTAGIVHGAIRPGHIFVCHATRHRPSIARIFDFGRAFAELAGASHIPREAFEEAFQYTAPEQLIGAPLDASSDIYAFGVLLYEMLAGERAFSADTTEELARRIKDGATKLLASVAPGIPMRLAHAIERAMAADPQLRYASLGEMIEALEPFDPTAGQPFVAWPVGPAVPTVRAPAAARPASAPHSTGASSSTALALRSSVTRTGKPPPPPPPPRRTVVSAVPPAPPPPAPPRPAREETPEEITTTSASWELTEPIRMRNFQLQWLIARFNGLIGLVGLSGRVGQRTAVWCLVLMASMIAARAVQRMAAPAFEPERSGASQHQQASPSLLDLDPADCNSAVGATDPRCAHAVPAPAASPPIRPTEPWTRDAGNTADAADSGMRREQPVTPKRSGPAPSRRAGARTRRSRSPETSTGRDATGDQADSDEFYTPGEADMRVRDVVAPAPRKHNVVAPREQKAEPRPGRRSRTGDGAARTPDALENLDRMRLQ